jgi:hypothetical protein
MNRIPREFKHPALHADSADSNASKNQTTRNWGCNNVNLASDSSRFAGLGKDTLQNMHLEQGDLFCISIKLQKTSGPKWLPFFSECLLCSVPEYII